MTSMTPRAFLLRTGYCDKFLCHLRSRAAANTVLRFALLFAKDLFLQGISLTSFTVCKFGKFQTCCQQLVPPSFDLRNAFRLPSHPTLPTLSRLEYICFCNTFLIIRFVPPTTFSISHRLRDATRTLACSVRASLEVLPLTHGPHRPHHHFSRGSQTSISILPSSNSSRSPVRTHLGPPIQLSFPDRYERRKG